MSSHKLTLHLYFLPDQLFVFCYHPWRYVSFCAALFLLHSKVTGICFPYPRKLPAVQGAQAIMFHSSVLLLQVSGVLVQSESSQHPVW